MRTSRLRNVWLQANRWWLAGMLFTGLLANCDTATELGADLPPTDNITGTIYIDTLTVRTATVLVDSVATSNTDYLVLGRYADSRLGTLTARSYARLGLGAAAFEPEASMVYDSLVLVLIPDAYRYGDTTRSQELQVHRLREELRANTTYYAFNSLSYDARALGTRRFRARPRLDTLRIKLDDALGEELFTAGRSRQLGTNDELAALLPGLALTPGASDDAAVLRFSATNTATALQLYYHDPDEPATALTYAFTVAGGNRRFYQLQALRNGTPLSSLTTYLQALPSARTAAEAYIQGAWA